MKVLVPPSVLALISKQITSKLSFTNVCIQNGPFNPPRAVPGYACGNARRRFPYAWLYFGRCPVAVPTVRQEKQEKGGK